MSTYKELLTRENKRSLMVGFILLTLAMIFQFYASAYSNRVTSNFVPDLILDHLPVVNLNFVIVEGALATIAGSIILLLVRPRYILFTLKAVAIFIATRAVFISVTHLGIYPGQAGPDPTGIFDHIYTGLGLEAGFFFSGHTGLTFLMALIFWNKRFWRIAFLGLAVTFGIAVLFAHVHYTIDVLAAPYMSYGIFKMSQYFFKEDYDLIPSS
jgi:ABC-type multidrug transport system fused ATPase/permease subunit